MGKHIALMADERLFGCITLSPGVAQHWRYSSRRWLVRTLLIARPLPTITKPRYARSAGAGPSSGAGGCAGRTTAGGLFSRLISASLARSVLRRSCAAGRWWPKVAVWAAELVNPALITTMTIATHAITTLVIRSSLECIGAMVACSLTALNKTEWKHKCHIW